MHKRLNPSNPKWTSKNFLINAFSTIRKAMFGCLYFNITHSIWKRLSSMKNLTSGGLDHGKLFSDHRLPPSRGLLGHLRQPRALRGDLAVQLLSGVQKLPHPGSQRKLPGGRSAPGPRRAGQNHPARLRQGKTRHPGQYGGSQRKKVFFEGGAGRSMSIFPLLRAICRGGPGLLRCLTSWINRRFRKLSLATRRVKVSAKERPPPKGRWAEKA